MSARARLRSVLSGPRYNELVDEMVNEYRRRVDMFVDELTAGGYPPFTHPRSPEDRWRMLARMKAVGDPEFDRAAANELRKLEFQFGPGQLALMGEGNAVPVVG